jgi:hypothetical protein
VTEIGFQGILVDGGLLFLGSQLIVLGFSLGLHVAKPVWQATKM